MRGRRTKATPRRTRTSEPSRSPEAEALGLLGIARRAGAIAPGVDQSRRAIRGGRACLLLTAEGASSVQLEKVVPLARRGRVPTRTVGDKIRLGQAVGAPPLAAVAVTERRFAEQLLSRLPRPEGDGPEYG